jgi:hypothetical protein
VARGYLVFGDIEGKLDILRVVYNVRRLIEKYGRQGQT